MLPLAGLRVIAVEQYGAGPIATQYLVDMGAEIIKIENPNDGGDVSRSVGPYFLGDGKASNDSIFYQGLNHNKKSITLNLREAKGKEILHRLVKDADALICNLRGDVPEKLGITYEHLKHINPALVCGHLTAYGRDGDRANWPGYDYMMQAEAGYFALTGEPGTPPTRFGLSVIDFMTGLALAFATVTALLSARETGQGRDIDVNLFDMALYNLNYIANWQLNAGHNQKRSPRSAHPSLTPCQLYKTKDGWIYLMCNKEKFWQTLCTHIERVDLIEHPDFINFKERLKNRESLTVVLDEELSRKSTDDWMEDFNGRVPAAPIYDVEQAVNSTFVQETGRVKTIQHSKEQTFKIMRSPVLCDEELALETSPELGQHTEEVLLRAGFTEAELKGFRAGNVI